MTTRGYALFDTALGCCGIAWGEDGLIGLQLPERDLAATRTRLRRRFPDAAAVNPPPAVRQVIDGVTALLRGAPAAFGEVRLDLAGIDAFDRDVYAAARTIERGHTLTYGAVAARLGMPRAAREVGQALGRNPFPLVVPCHRVVATGGELGGFSASGGAATKRRLLEIEGAPLPPQNLELFADLPGSAAGGEFRS